MSLRTGATADLRQQIAKNPERDGAVISGAGGGTVAFNTPYNRDFVNDLKNNIASGMRKWNPSKKQWEVAPEAADTARDIASQYFHVADGTKLNASQIKQVKQSVRTTRIKNTQKNYGATWIESSPRLPVWIKQSADIAIAAGAAAKWTQSAGARCSNTRYVI